MRRLGWAATAVVAMVTGISCATETLNIAETDLVLTIKDPDADYASLKTYALTDEVTDLCSVDPPDLGLGGLGGLPGTGLDDANCSPLAARFDSVILDSIEENMTALGYKKVSLSASPDVAIVVGTVVRTEWYYVPGYPWCDPFYYYYCWYPPTGYTYSFSKGSVLINMIDGQSEPGTPNSLWFAGISGLYEASSTVSGSDRIQIMIDRAFAQSPYLAEGGAQ